MLTTNLFDTPRLLAELLGDLYHRCWPIEEAFKRLKHRVNLEHVTGLSQLAIMQDFAAKIVCDDWQALTAAAAHTQTTLAQDQWINRAYAHTALKPLLPALLLGTATAHQLQQLISLISGATYHHRPGGSKPREKHSKPHKSMPKNHANAKFCQVR